MSSAQDVDVDVYKIYFKDGKTVEALRNITDRFYKKIDELSQSDPEFLRSNTSFFEAVADAIDSMTTYLKLVKAKANPLPNNPVSRGLSVKPNGEKIMTIYEEGKESPYTISLSYVWKEEKWLFEGYVFNLDLE